MAIKLRWIPAGLAITAVLWALGGADLRAGGDADDSLMIAPYMDLRAPALSAVFDTEDRTYGGTGAAANAGLSVAGFKTSCTDASYALVGQEGILLGGGLFCPNPDIALASQMAADAEAALVSLPGWRQVMDRASDPRRAPDWGTSINEAFEALSRDRDVLAPILRIPLSDWEHESGAKLFLNAAKYRESGGELPHVNIELALPQDCMSRFLIYTRVTESDPDWTKPENAAVIAAFGNRVYTSIPMQERGQLTGDYIREACRLE